MDTQIVAVYCICADVLMALHHREDRQCRLSDAEVMTIALIAALYFGGNYAQSYRFLQQYGYISCFLSKSRFSRRLHRIKHLFLLLFGTLGEVFKAMNEESIYILDSFPIAACDNYRIPRAKLY